MATYFDKFENSVRLRRLNRWVQILLFLAFIAGINYAATHFFWRVDLTQRHLFSLSPETIGYLREIREPIEVIVTIPSDSPLEDERLLARYVRGLLRQYEYTARAFGTTLTVEYVDIFKNVQRAAQLARDYQLESPNVVMFKSGDRRRAVLPVDILEFDEQRPTAFRGEQAFTSAIIEVAATDRPVIYFTVGQSEMRLEDTSPGRGLSVLARELQARNFALGNLDLSQVDAVPDDASLVVVKDPQGALLASSQEKLRRFVNERAGRLMVFISPGRMHGLDDLFFEWGILADDMVVLEQGADFLEGSGNYLVRNFGEHPITEVLIRNQTFVVTGLSRPVRPDPGAPFDDRLRTHALMASSRDSWGERAYRQAVVPQFDPDVDLPGPVPVATVAERRASSQLGINVQGGRVLVVGSGDLLANRRIGNVGNFSFVFSSLNWMLDRDRMLAIPPRPIERYELTASQATLQRIALLFLLVPLGVAALGFFLIWLRRW
ncbi:MAG: GldG family protein [Verrucomicrobia bacterium]|nr:GldG family protein [Verrucomicrobiota bacterium]